MTAGVCAAGVPGADAARGGVGVGVVGRRRRRLVMRCVSRARALRPQSVRPHPRHWWGSSYSRAAPRSGTRGHPSWPLRRLKRKLLLLTLLLPGPTPRTCRWRGRWWPRTVRTGRAWTTALRQTTTAWSRGPPRTSAAS
ncbi:hypothetical protein GQ55_4G200600 [Panicum hallii var. hallii]|uniref:Uncharacterized protein n=1 Tax=Panicum hallii var. hallii TaxID=1504633 RepID=A0A2T7DZ46_9POAL|nr:hypothetical protein GQ55_4G200600 [Panicum hallii var. hallii]